jgi:hypothetical protein
MDDYEFIVRRPRHDAVSDSGCLVTAGLPGGSDIMCADLGDVSRLGLKLILDSHIPADTQLQLHLEQPATQFQVTLSITVRWSRIQDNGRWAAGCIFDRELSWELMGELFLNGILSADEIPDDRVADRIQLRI